MGHNVVASSPVVFRLPATVSVEQQRTLFRSTERASNHSRGRALSDDDGSIRKQHRMKEQPVKSLHCSLWSTLFSVPLCWVRVPHKFTYRSSNFNKRKSATFASILSAKPLILQLWFWLAGVTNLRTIFNRLGLVNARASRKYCFSYTLLQLPSRYARAAV